MLVLLHHQHCVGRVMMRAVAGGGFLVQRSAGGRLCLDWGRAMTRVRGSSGGQTPCLGWCGGARLRVPVGLEGALQSREMA